MLFSQWMNMLEGSRAYSKNSSSVVPVLSVCSFSDSDSDSDSGQSGYPCDSKGCNFDVILSDFARVARSESLLAVNVGRPSTACSSVKTHSQESQAVSGASETAAAKPAAIGANSEEEGKKEGGESGSGGAVEVRAPESL